MRSHDKKNKNLSLFVILSSEIFKIGLRFSTSQDIRRIFSKRA